jgi:putative FmdB family regulatory protein
MPTYGYRCRSCGNEFEVLQKISDPPLKTCPKCAGKLDKMVYAAGIIYKGSGYYNTDYKSGSKGAEKASDKADSNGSGSSSEGSGDAKPAAEPKTESKAPKSDSSE